MPSLHQARGSRDGAIAPAHHAAAVPDRGKGGGGRNHLWGVGGGGGAGLWQKVCDPNIRAFFLLGMLKLVLKENKR